MSQILNDNEIKLFKRDGAVFLRNKFDIKWIELLRSGINKAKNNPSPRFTNHTTDPNLPCYLEDFWTWNLHKEFENFVFNSPTAKIASELLDAKQINLVMDNWFFREAGSTSKPPFHHDISYFDFEGSMCVLWIPLEPVRKEDSIAWIKGSHLWDKLFLRTRFKDGHKVDGAEGVVNGVKYELTPDIISNKENYEFLEWDLEVGDCVYFDIRTLHGALYETTPKSDINRFTLRMAKENSKIIYRGDWAREERSIMEANGYKNGDDLSGKMFPTLYAINSN
ncbi:phytanoyl-CoA dioxygenase family protein [Candidatus Pelagibacter sp. HIMB1715]|uniref:phytanoyl-CoA dioxygenase family protein n=1 Tax=Candidatus Pelagibacter sp. HIMB1715 TaxID=3413369 RepID=UPI003F849BC1